MYGSYVVVYYSYEDSSLYILYMTTVLKVADRQCDAICALQWLLKGAMLSDGVQTVNFDFEMTLLIQYGRSFAVYYENPCSPLQIGVNFISRKKW